MSPPRFIVAMLAGVAALVLTGTPSASAVSPPAAVRTIYYDSSRAAELSSLVDQAADIWNTRVTSVKLEKGQAGISVSTAQNGPAPGMASCVGCTRGTITFYRNQIQQSGAGPLRVVVHELGHILSLEHPPDIGNCDKVMAGGRCDNPYPNADEVAAVQRFWSGVLRPARPAPRHADERSTLGAPALASR
ncbi:snapalysin family zinc-dependent metalloprotease [Actinomadura decatromicini]|uniref:Extracellular small neutral protease n=1 Tax=Actinomadura decatromicini TaxID=2604572 RepID=A0A5D3F627_9ACTN|nr:snapalysin family zinc-dependent metalloprotease [Actinomadura decatromicini]TYK43130.1 snapalysin family zinc-dependent metalloprotease [Actinomadura decatromicini]